jgi:hypothetical protein
MKQITLGLAVAVLASVSSVPAAAQNAGEATVDTSYGNPQPQEDNDFPWGLLGLVGLAGLLGRKRKEPDIHVDARRNNRP